MGVIIEPHQDFHNIYWVYENGTKRLATKNLIPERSVYGERLVRYKDNEYRLWDPFRSKFAAAIINGIETVPIQSNHKVLYLGAASGTTPSHVSDIVGHTGFVYCVEFAHRTIRELVNNVCAFRTNMSPIFADARFPERYLHLLEKADVTYCDVAQPEQAKILADNADLFLKTRGLLMLAIKARSINVTKTPKEVFQSELDVLKDRGFHVEDVVNLNPYDQAHIMVVAHW